MKQLSWGAAGAAVPCDGAEAAGVEAIEAPGAVGKLGAPTAFGTCALRGAFPRG